MAKNIPGREMNNLGSKEKAGGAGAEKTGGSTRGMETEGSAGVEPQGLVDALRGLDFESDGRPVWGFKQGGDMILCFGKTRWMGEEWSGEEQEQARSDGGLDENEGS